jgi:hypothetical protein
MEGRRVRSDGREGRQQSAQRRRCCCFCRFCAARTTHNARTPRTHPNQTTAEIGLGLAAFGLLFTILGVFLFFDRGLLAMGNVRVMTKEREGGRGGLQEAVRARCTVCFDAAKDRGTHNAPSTAKHKQQLLFLAGMTLTIGVQATLQFFTRRKHRQGSAFYLGGAALVVIGWTFIGLLLEAYGFWLLFCEFIPTVLSYSRRVPFVGRMLEVPWLRNVRLSFWGRWRWGADSGFQMLPIVQGVAVASTHTLTTHASTTTATPTAVQQGDGRGGAAKDDGRRAQPVTGARTRARARGCSSNAPTARTS